MIPIILVTGFLGSGKTTLLQEIHKKNHQRRIVYLVNDYSVRDVDGSFFSNTDRKVISVAGGSIFCTCKVGEFVSKLNGIREMERDGSNPVEGLVIEASGIANPTVIRTLLNDSGMNRFYKLNNIISVADPISFPLLKQTLPNIVQQIKNAGDIILNKSDLTGANEIEKIILQIKKINDKAAVHVTQHCRIRFNPLDSNEYDFQESSSDSMHEPDVAYSKFSIQIRKPVNLGRLKELIKNNPKIFYRIKGFIIDDKKNMWHLDYSVSSGLKLDSAESIGHPHLEFIFSSDNVEKTIKRLNLFSREGFQ